MDQLIFVFPVSNLTFMIIKTILIIIEIRQKLPIIKYNTLGSINLR